MATTGIEAAAAGSFAEAAPVAISHVTVVASANLLKCCLGDGKRHTSTG
jgi:hypothetical protein